MFAAMCFWLQNPPRNCLFGLNPRFKNKTKTNGFFPMKAEKLRKVEARWMLMNERALSLRLGETLFLVSSVGHVQHKGPEAAVVIIIDAL